MTAGELVSARMAGNVLTLSAAGSWTAANAGLLEARLAEIAAQARGAASAAIDLAAIERFDSYGAWLLERFRRQMEAGGIGLQVNGLSAANLPLLQEMEQVNRHPAAPPHRFPFGRTVESLSLLTGALMRDLASFATMTGAIAAALGRLSLRPGSFRLTSSVHQFDRVGWQAVPIIVMITFLIGAILAQQGFFHFRQFGADLYVVDMVGFLIMRELGVLLVAIMVAGRTGSAYTAELGSMKMREEVDALRTMGFDPVEILIVPRILILVAALPVLTFIGSMSALFGSGLVSVFYGGMSMELYVDRLREAISMDHFLVGMIKAPFIGFVIGVIACNEGLAVKGSAASLGHQTTQAVVKSIFMVIAMDALFAIFFSAIRM